MSAEKPAPSLADLRQEIDRIDEAMHRLLMERGTIIDRLIASKKASQAGLSSAFRPGREASMMKALAERHEGLLPLDTVESIWRVIIGTFTYVQSNYSVHADVSAGDAPMRDSARFHFGFTVPYITHPSAAAVIEAVASSRGDLVRRRLPQSCRPTRTWQASSAPTCSARKARPPPSVRRASRARSRSSASMPARNRSRTSTMGSSTS
jgi:chorismate mutase